MGRLVRVMWKPETELELMLCFSIWTATLVTAIIEYTT